MTVNGMWSLAFSCRANARLVVHVAEPQLDRRARAPATWRERITRDRRSRGVGPPTSSAALLASLENHGPREGEAFIIYAMNDEHADDWHTMSSASRVWRQDAFGWRL